MGSTEELQAPLTFSLKLKSMYTKDKKQFGLPLAGLDL